MKTQIKLTVGAAFLGALLLGAQSALAQSNPAQSTTPATPAELEAIYTASIEYRATDIVDALKLADPAKAAKVHDLIVDQYRVMRARDALIDAQLRAQGSEVNFANRAAKLKAESKVLHDSFFAQLGQLLTPEQVEIVKDKMTYNKVTVTFDAYCAIIGNLTDQEKAKIQELLKAAREEAVDGGSATEKSAIFQQYKDQINAYLTANGHDVTKAFKDWAEKNPGTNNAAK